MKRYRLVWLLLVMAMAMPAAWAQRGGGPGDRGGRGGFGGPPGGFPPFLNPVQAVLDTDHDGTLSAEEIADASKSILKLDTNEDGALSAQELRPDPVEFMKTYIMGMDADGNGKVEEGELSDRMTGMLERGDRNGDKALEASEIEAMLRNSFGRRGGNQGGRFGPGGPRGRGQQQPQRPLPTD